MARKTNFVSNGKSYYRVNAVIGKNPDGSYIRKQFLGKSKKEAEAKRDDYMLNIRRGLPHNYDKAMFSNVFETWFENVLRPTLALASYIRYETDYRLRIRNSTLSPRRLADIKALDVQEFYNALLKSHSVNTVRNTHKLLSVFFTYCVKSELIAKSPLLAVELPRERAIKEKSYVLSKNDITKLIDTAKEHPDCFIFVFALFTGLRQGELLALTVGDIDLTEDAVSVNKTVSHLTVDGVYHAALSAPKTDSSVRVVPILGEVKGMLQRHVAIEREKHLALGLPFTDESILFSATTGEYVNASNLRKRWGKLCDRLGIPKMPFHGLRHCFCSLLSEAGVPLKTASDLMGHSNIAITAKIYTHSTEDMKKTGVEKLAGLFKAE